MDFKNPTLLVLCTFATLQCALCTPFYSTRVFNLTTLQNRTAVLSVKRNPKIYVYDMPELAAYRHEDVHGDISDK